MALTISISHRTTATGFMIIQNGTISVCADINEAEQLLSE
jgi:hypothetical protein